MSTLSPAPDPWQRNLTMAPTSTPTLTPTLEWQIRRKDVNGAHSGSVAVENGLHELQVQSE